MNTIRKLILVICSIILFHSFTFSQELCEHDMPEVVCPGESYIVTFPNVTPEWIVLLYGSTLEENQYFTKLTYNTFSINIPTDYTSSVINVRTGMGANGIPFTFCESHKLLILRDGSINQSPNDSITEYVACENSELNIIGGFEHSCQTCEDSWLLNGQDISNQVNYDEITNNDGDIIFSNISISIGTPDLYEFCYRLDSPDGLCFDEFCYNIEVPDLSSTPSFDIVGGISEICTNQELTFINTSDFAVLNPDAGSFVWVVTNSNGVPFASDNSVDFQFDFEDVGTYNVELTYLIQSADGSCTTATAIQTIIVNPNEGIEITCPSVVCGGEEIDYTIADVDCSLYTWSNSLNAPATTSSDNCTYSVTWDEVNEYTIGAVILELTNCTSGSCCPTIIDVPIFPTEMEIDGPTNLCQTSQTPVTYMVDAIPGSFYNWTLVGPNGDVPLVNNSGPAIEISFPDNGSYALTVTVDNPYAGCDLTATLNIVNPKISGGKTICLGSSFELYYIVDNNPTITYEISNLSGQIFASGTQPSNSAIVFMPPEIGNYVLNIINGEACFEPIILSVVTVTSLFIDGEQDVCPGEQYEYTASCGPNESITWNTPLNGTIDNSADCSVTITWSANETEFQVSGTKEMVVDDGVICTADLNVLNATASMPSLSISGNSPICYDMVESYIVNDIPFAIYNWTISPSFMGSVIGGQGSSEAYIQWLYSTTEIEATVTCSINSCGQVISTDFTVDFESFNTQITDPFTICEGDEAIVTVSGINSAITTWDNIAWTLNGVPYDNTMATLNLMDLEPGVNTIGVTVVNPNGCVGYEQLNTTVTVNPDPGPLLETFRNVCPKTDVVDFSVSIANATGASYVWYVNEVLQPSSTSSIILTPADLLLSTLTVTAEVTINGCTFIVSDDLAYSCPDSGGENPNGCPAFNIGINLFEFDDCDHVNFEGNMAINNLNQNWTIYYEYQTPLQSLEETIDIQSSADLMNDATLSSGPGRYTLMLRSEYCCADDGVTNCNAFVISSLLLPFEQDFNYTFVCNSNNSYDLILNDASTYAPDNVNQSQIDYTWSSKGTPFASGLSQISANLTGLMPGTSVDIALSLDGYGFGPSICPAVIKTIQVPALPDATFDISTTYNCRDEIITFDHNQENIVSVLWEFDDGSKSQKNPITKIFNSLGTQFVDLTLTDEYGCSNTETNTFEIVDNSFNGSLTYSMEGSCNSMATLTFNPAPGQPDVDQYSWSIGDITPASINSIMITQSEEYFVTITDVSGCRHVFESGYISLVDAFGSDITVTSNDCGEKTINYTTVEGHSYVHYVNLDGVVTCNNASSFYDEGAYIVTVYAFNTPGADCDTDISESCAMDVITFDVLPVPPKPKLIQSSNCEDESVTIDIYQHNANYDVVWTGNNILPVYDEESIIVFENGDYTVTYIDTESGCSASRTIKVVSAAIDFDGMITGCYSFCEEDEYILPEVISPPSYESTPNMQWSWLLNNIPIAGASGSGDPANLDLSSLAFEIDTEYKITFSVDIGDCTFESDPFCFIIENCAMLDCLVYPDGEACGYNPVDCAVSEEDGGPVYFINMNYYIPSGDDFDPPIPNLNLSYCGIEPTITSNGTLTVSSIEQVYSDQLNLIGSFSVDDPSIWSAANPITVQVIYCDKEDNNKLYCVEYQINEVHCPNDPLECNVWFTGFTSGKEKGDDDNYYANYCVTLYNVDSKGCESTEWDIEGIVRSLDGTETTIYTESVSIAGEGDVYTHCFSVPIPNDFDITLNPYIGFNITSNCPGIGCFHEFHNFGTENTSSNPVVGTGKKNCDNNRFDIKIPNDMFIPYQQGDLFLNGNSIPLVDDGVELSGGVSESGINESLPQNLGVVEYQNNKGEYSIVPVVLDVEGCAKKRSSLNETFNVYPNPFTHGLNITGKFNKSTYVKITDALGRAISVDIQFSETHLEVNFDEPAGIYFISIYDNGNNVFFEKVFKIE